MPGAGILYLVIGCGILALLAWLGIWLYRKGQEKERLENNETLINNLPDAEKELQGHLMDSHDDPNAGLIVQNRPGSIKKHPRTPGP